MDMHWHVDDLQEAKWKDKLNHKTHRVTNDERISESNIPIGVVVRIA